jgi:hypothetical protein
MRGRSLINKRTGTSILRALALLTLGLGASVPGFGQSPAQHGADSKRWIRYWNQVAIDASGLDHTAVAPGEQRVFGEQLGPCRAARAIAIVHIAIFDAVNDISGGYFSYSAIAPARDRASMKASIAQAAHDTLAALFPSQSPSFDARLAADLALIPDDRHKLDGIDVGHRAAAAIYQVSSLGIPILAPEIQLLYKAKHHLPKDEHDFQHALPFMSAAQRAWLKEMLPRCYGEDRWITEL